MPNSEYKMQDSKWKMFEMEYSLQLLPVQRVASLTRWKVRRSSCSSLRNTLGSQPDCGQHRHQEASLRKAISICRQAFSCRPKEASFWKPSKWSWLKFREGVGRKRTLSRISGKIFVTQDSLKIQQSMFLLIKLSKCCPVFDCFWSVSWSKSLGLWWCYTALSWNDRV